MCFDIGNLTAMQTTAQTWMQDAHAVCLVAALTGIECTNLFQSVQKSTRELHFICTAKLGYALRTVHLLSGPHTCCYQNTFFNHRKVNVAIANTTTTANNLKFKHKSVVLKCLVHDFLTRRLPFSRPLNFTIDFLQKVVFFILGMLHVHTFPIYFYYEQCT